MITGVKTGNAAALTRPVAVGIIGGGIAGASVAAGLRHRGIEATILDAGPGLATAAWVIGWPCDTATDSGSQ